MMYLYSPIHKIAMEKMIIRMEMKISIVKMVRKVNMISTNK